MQTYHPHQLTDLDELRQVVMAKRLTFIVEIDQPIGMSPAEVEETIKDLLVPLPLDDAHPLWGVSGAVKIRVVGCPDV